MIDIVGLTDLAFHGCPRRLRHCHYLATNSRSCGRLPRSHHLALLRFHEFIVRVLIFYIADAKEALASGLSRRAEVLILTPLGEQRRIAIDIRRMSHVDPSVFVPPTGRGFPPRSIRLIHLASVMGCFPLRPASQIEVSPVMHGSTKRARPLPNRHLCAELSGVVGRPFEEGTRR
jgi:hypothetical protein